MSWRSFAQKLLALPLAALCLTLLLAPTPARADEGGFTIENLSVQATVGLDNVYDVTETIVVHFSEPRHGIYRNIPVRGDLVRESATYGRVESELHARVSGVSVEGAPYEVDSDNGEVSIRIGDPDETVTGVQTYVIRYRYAMGNDHISDFDEVYYNLIGTGWDTTIAHADFLVTLPVAFDPALVGVVAGTQGQQITDAATFSVEGRTISGQTTRALTNYEGLTLRVELPEGTFVLPDYHWVGGVLLVLEWLLAGLAVFFWWRWGRDDRLVRTVEFYAPDGMTPAEVGYLFDGNVDNRDVVSLLLYWADRGYLTITDLGSSDYLLSRKGNPGKDARSFETHMFQKLFADGDEVTVSSLKERFYTTIQTTRNMVNDSFSSKSRRVFTRASVLLEPLITLMAALPVLATLAYGLTLSSGYLEEALVPACVVGALVLAPVYLLVYVLRRYRSMNAGPRVALTVVATVLLAGLLALFAALTVPQTGWPLALTAMVTTAITALAASFIRRRTAQGTLWLGRILGLRDFLLTAERDRIVALVDQNPSYFFNVLPYAYVLGVTDKFAKNFEGIAIAPPDWYVGTGNFAPLYFAHSMTRTMAAMQAVMVSQPQSSGNGGGGFSGGGFSGGGGGGGGGGSW